MNNGLVESFINKLKVIKRAMYNRTEYELLKEIFVYINVDKSLPIFKKNLDML